MCRMIGGSREASGLPSCVWWEPNGVPGDQWGTTHGVPRRVRATGLKGRRRGINGGVTGRKVVHMSGVLGSPVRRAPDVGHGDRHNTTDGGGPLRRGGFLWTRSQTGDQ
jgi:hypothetical protein